MGKLCWNGTHFWFEHQLAVYNHSRLTRRTKQARGWTAETVRKETGLQHGTMLEVFCRMCHRIQQLTHNFVNDVVLSPGALTIDRGHRYWMQQSVHGEGAASWSLYSEEQSTWAITQRSWDHAWTDIRIGEMLRNKGNDHDKHQPKLWVRNAFGIQTSLFPGIYRSDIQSVCKRLSLQILLILFERMIERIHRLLIM